MKMKELSIYIVIFVLMFSYQITGVHAQEVITDGFLIESGSLGILADRNENLNLVNDRWTITLGSNASLQKCDHITVSDLTGKNEGWTVSVDLSNFTNSTSIVDPTVHGAELDVFVEAEDWLSFKLYDDSNCLNELKPEGSSITPVSSNGTAVSPEHYTVNNRVTDSGKHELLQVVPGYGAGEFDFYLLCNITVSDWLPDGTIIRSTAESSAFPFNSPVIVDNSKQKYQVFAGTYQITMTYSVSGNPTMG